VVLVKLPNILSQILRLSTQVCLVFFKLCRYFCRCGFTRFDIVVSGVEITFFEEMQAEKTNWKPLCYSETVFLHHLYSRKCLLIVIYSTSCKMVNKLVSNYAL